MPAVSPPSGASTASTRLRAIIHSCHSSSATANSATEEAEEPGGQVVDLMAALQESVRKAQAARGEDAGDAEVHEMPTAKKKTAGKTARKAPAKKTAKKSAAAKKPARRQRGA
ncbi:hypothetical protein [Streptomyces mirabilis]|uniref:hypothetical protein n=1 Tax=Streptomyces mirabilis TaxID=68239 RepID=UPI002B1CBDCA|nr:hypothetical protein [Streptomyces mirabilis]